MEKLGLDNYAALYYKLSIVWIICLCISFIFGIWWSVFNINAVCIPVIDFLSICGLLISGRFNQKYAIHSNTPLKFSVGLMGVILLAKTSLSIWTSVIFKPHPEIISNIVILWVITTVFIVTFLCLVLPIAMVFWDLRSEDLVKVQDIGGRIEQPKPIPISSENNLEINSTQK